ncbi:MAG TPA: SRPBCC family protein [Baekduia sp.]
MISTNTAIVTLPTDDQILITREFDAPAHLVWRAVTEPDLVRQWWGAGHGEMTVCDIDLRVGGTWRYAQTTPDGQEVGFHGEYLELVQDERIVNTEIFDPFPDNGATTTMTLVEAGGRTTLTTLVQHGTAEARDMHIASGMESGMQASFDALERVAVSLR